MTTPNTFDMRALPVDLQKAKKEIYDPLGLTFSHPLLHSESLDYGACSFQLNGKTVQHRVSKITPRKTGQFVTLWKRNKAGITQPFDTTDALDFIIITTRSENHCGQFIFPKSILVAQGIISKEGKGGKRGIRVYPPWDLPTSKQAAKTQSWQTQHFIALTGDQSAELEALKKLFTQDFPSCRI